MAVRLVVDSGGGHRDDNVAPVVPIRPNTASSASGGGHDPGPDPFAGPPADEDVDMSDLVDAPPGSVKSPEDRLAEAFPGSVFIEESR